MCFMLRDLYYDLYVGILIDWKKLLINVYIIGQLRKKLGDSYKSLPPDEKAKYTKPLNVSDYDAQTDTDGQLQTKMDKQILDTRCAPDRFSDLVQAFNVEKQRAILEI